MKNASSILYKQISGTPKWKGWRGEGGIYISERISTHTFPADFGNALALIPEAEGTHIFTFL